MNKSNTISLICCVAGVILIIITVFAIIGSEKTTTTTTKSTASYTPSSVATTTTKSTATNAPNNATKATTQKVEEKAETWHCVDATSYNKNPYDDNKCTSSKGRIRYVSDSEARSLDPTYIPGKSGNPYYNSF